MDVTWGHMEHGVFKHFTMPAQTPRPPSAPVRPQSPRMRIGQQRPGTAGRPGILANNNAATLDPVALRGACKAPNAAAPTLSPGRGAATAP